MTKPKSLWGISGEIEHKALKQLKKEMNRKFAGILRKELEKIKILINDKYKRRKKI